jgi:hypothetical protein
MVGILFYGVLILNTTLQQLEVSRLEFCDPFEIYIHMK